ncbi:MAG: transporter substrate-binding domain-containing protein [Roseiarcus sp.]|jgi:ABC-type amino acid transport substrate-binding protein
MIDRRANQNLAGSAGRIGRLFRFLLAGLGAAAALATAADCAPGAEPAVAEPLRVAVYDVPPYGYVDADGSIGGVSVDLWRRVAQQTEWQFRLIPVSDMETILRGLEKGWFDAAIGAITITPERSERVDFSYPAHRSGVAVAFRKDTGPLSALSAYGAAAAELSPLILVILAMLVVTGVAMWFLERPRHPAAQGTESSVASLRDGVYWAVVTMTTVGYGDKTPKTNSGRIIAIAWMMGSLVLVSLLSTSMVSRLTAERVESGADVASSDLVGKRLAAAANSSGAEYLDAMHLQYEKFPNLQQALGSLANGQTDAVVNSVGALQYFIAKRYAKVVQTPRGLLAPAYMAVALPAGSPLKKPLDRALMKITAGSEWRSAEQRFFGR